jgi:hypothetical protein
MVREPVSMDISHDPGLLQLAQEVRRTGRPRLLRFDGEDIAVLMPAKNRARRRATGHRTSISSGGTAAIPRGSIVARTAGAVRRAETPYSREEEREAFERGVAEEVIASMDR